MLNSGLYSLNEREDGPEPSKIFRFATASCGGTGVMLMGWRSWDCKTSLTLPISFLGCEEYISAKNR